MKKSKKKLKAMTLVEVLTALAIFTIMSSLLASAVVFVCEISGKTDKLNKKIVVEGPDAELRKNGREITEATEPTLHIKIGSSNEFNVDYRKYAVEDPSDNYPDGGDFKYLLPK